MNNKLIKQKFYGIMMLLLCVFIVVMALQGSTVEERDITPVIIFAPAGFYLLFSKDDLLY